jgi:hypothetical protein
VAFELELPSPDAPDFCPEEHATTDTSAIGTKRCSRRHIGPSSPFGPYRQKRAGLRGASSRPSHPNNNQKERPCERKSFSTSMVEAFRKIVQQ